MSDIALPDGYSLSPPEASAAALPDGYTLQGPGSPNYAGSMLPLSTDAAGNPRLDFNAGITGMAKRLVTGALSAAAAPGDVASGRTPILAPNGQPNPDLLTRATTLAAMATPVSAAMRSGEMIPGLMWNRNVPSAQQLKSAAGAGYDAARGAGLDISGDAVGAMARGLQQSLQSDGGIIAKTAPKTFGILDELATPPAGGFATVPGLDAARQGLSGIIREGGTEGLAARRAVRGIDDFMSSLDGSAVAETATGAGANAAGGPAPEAVAATLRDARGNYAAAQRSNDLTGTLDRANTGIGERAEARAHASNSGANIDNAIRQRVASFLQNPANVAGFSPSEIDALNAVVKGGAVQNGARRLANLLGGGGGAGAAFTSALGLGAGHYLGGPEGGEIGMLLAPATGVSAKALENALARRSLNRVDEMVRMRSPLADEMKLQGLLATPAIGRNAATMRTLLPGLLSPQPAPTLPQTGPFGPLI